MFSLLNLNNLFADVEVGEMVGSIAWVFSNSVGRFNAGRLLISVEKVIKEEYCRGKGRSSEIMDEAAA